MLSYRRQPLNKPFFKLRKKLKNKKITNLTTWLSGGLLEIFKELKVVHQVKNVLYISKELKFYKDNLGKKDIVIFSFQRLV